MLLWPIMCRKGRQLIINRFLYGRPGNGQACAFGGFLGVGRHAVQIPVMGKIACFGIEDDFPPGGLLVGVSHARLVEAVGEEDLAFGTPENGIDARITLRSEPYTQTT